MGALGRAFFEADPGAGPLKRVKEPYRARYKVVHAQAGQRYHLQIIGSEHNRVAAV